MKDFRLRLAATAVRLLWLLPLSLVALLWAWGAVWDIPRILMRPLGTLFHLALAGVLLWVSVRAWRKTVRIARGTEDVSTRWMYAQLGGFLFTVLLLGLVAVPKFRDLLRYSGEGQNKGNLSLLRQRLMEYHGAEGGYPPDLESLVREPGLVRIPELWRVWGAGLPHAKSAQVELRRGKVLRDTGHWAYVNAPGSPDFGSVYIDCTHTDARGELWAGY